LRRAGLSPALDRRGHRRHLTAAGDGAGGAVAHVARFDDEDDVLGDVGGVIADALDVPFRRLRDIDAVPRRRRRSSRQDTPSAAPCAFRGSLFLERPPPLSAA